MDGQGHTDKQANKQTSKQTQTDTNRHKQTQTDPDRYRHPLSLSPPSLPSLLSDEKRQKYLQLVKHEQEMDTFLLSFDSQYEEEKSAVSSKQEQVVSLLGKITHCLESQQSLPSRDEATMLKSDLDFKSGELQKSKATAKALEVG